MRMAIAALALLVSHAAFADSPDARADALVRSTMAAHQIPGVVLGVVRNGHLVKATGYGYANVELRVPVSTASIFQSGSVAKQFTATAIMMLVTEGKIGIDDPLFKYFPESRDSPARDVTVRQLLTHTAGFPDIYDATGVASSGFIDFNRDYTEDELLKIYLELKLDFPPGDKFNYSNTGYEILGFLIHRVAGEFYGDFLQRRIFQPLAMTSTRIISEQDIIPNRVAGYRIIEGKLKNQELIAPSLNTTADGGLYTNVIDLAKWDAALYTEKLLPRSALEQMWTPMRLNSGATSPYGFGWELDAVNGHPLFSHTGANQGFYISISRYIKDRLTIIVLTNLDSDHSSTLEIAEPVAAMYVPALKAHLP